MEQRDEKLIKVWIEYGIREEMQRIELRPYDEERVKRLINSAIETERRRIESEKSSKELPRTKYISVAVMTSLVWLSIGAVVIAKIIMH